MGNQEPPPSLKLDVDAAVDIAYETEYKGRRLRLYKENYVVEPGLVQRNLTLDNLLGTKYPYWAADIMLEITDEKGKTLWTFPEVSGLDDLLESVEYQAAGVSGCASDFRAWYCGGCAGRVAVAYR